MIFLKHIALKNFKGTKELSCSFDDFTLLAGLNNSGKTTLIQGVYLLVSSLKEIVQHGYLTHKESSVRTTSIHNVLGSMGMQNSDWLKHSRDSSPEIYGEFHNGLHVDLTLNGTQNVQYYLQHNDSVENAIKELAPLVAGLLTPPGEVSSREKMVNGDEYERSLREGTGAQLWRNGLWWAVQKEGFESFAPIQAQISKYFPDVELLLPQLSTSGTPEILIKYKERGAGPMDIAQSGTGLRTFISLSRILEQSKANVVLLDEPDSHLHSSQQAVILDLMLDVAMSADRQVIVATHSPEIISRAPVESIRWVDKEKSSATGGFEVSELLDQLGATPDFYIAKDKLWDILVYVEGPDDKPTIEALIKWCRQRMPDLPSAVVIPHKDGRFEKGTLKGIVNFAKEIRHKIRVVGIRDLDWYYNQFTISNDPQIDIDGNCSLVTLPCKELENLFCDSNILYSNFDQEVPEDDIERIIAEESKNSELVDEWKFQLLPRIRDSLPSGLDASTKEKQATIIFQEWENDGDRRTRFIAGKRLLSRIRLRTDKDFNKRFIPRRMLEKCNQLTPHLQSIANCIFPEFPDCTQPPAK